MYKKPTECGIKNAMECGWTKEQAERGYEIFDYDGTGLLIIEAIQDCYPDGDCDDYDASVEAERSGFCKIIPCWELSREYEKCFILNDCDASLWFGWVDTSENREAIRRYCKKEEEYLKKEEERVSVWKHEYHEGFYAVGNGIEFNNKMSDAWKEGYKDGEFALYGDDGDDVYKVILEEKKKECI